MKDSSLVRAAEAVRDGKASAMVSAGNTGATMAQRPAAHGPHQGRGPPGHRHADPRARRGTPDGAARRRRQRRVPGRVARAVRPDGRGVRPRPLRHRRRPKVGLLSIGEEPTKGNPLVKETHELLADGAWIGARRTFVGNVEGRDIMTDDVDVVVTDGFTGNVALKTLEGGMRALVGAVLGAFDATDEATGGRRGAAAGPAARSTRSSTPRTRRRHAPRRRRRLHHQPRLVVGHAPSSTPCGWPREMVDRPTSSADLPARPVAAG